MSPIDAKLNGTLPRGDGNGLGVIARDLVEHPERVHVCIVLIDAAHVDHETDTGNRTAKARIRRIEVIQDKSDKDRMRMLLLREFERRSGKTPLPFDLEEDIRIALGEMDPADRTLPGETDDED